MAPAAAFNLPAFVAALVAKQTRARISWREVSRQTGVASATLTRILHGKRPDVDTLAALARWLELPVGHFLGLPSESPISALSPFLQGRELTPDTVEALAHLVDSAHRLFVVLESKKNKPSRPRSSTR